jgi:hypothetical protein
MNKNNEPSFTYIDVSIDGEPWNEVETFENRAPEDPIYVLDRTAGTVSFGDGKHGRRPPAGSRIAATYRTGGGSAGNILSFTWTVTDPDIHQDITRFVPIRHLSRECAILALEIHCLVV